MVYVVTKPISGPEGEIPSGTLVTPQEWRNFRSLVNLGHIRPATPVDLEGVDTLQVDDHGISSRLAGQPPTRRNTKKKVEAPKASASPRRLRRVGASAH